MLVGALICVGLYFLYKWVRSTDGPPHEVLIIAAGLIIYYISDSFLTAFVIAMIAGLIDSFVYGN